MCVVDVSCSSRVSADGCVGSGRPNLRVVTCRVPLGATLPTHRRIQATPWVRGSVRCGDASALGVASMARELEHALLPYEPRCALAMPDPSRHEWGDISLHLSGVGGSSDKWGAPGSSLHVRTDWRGSHFGRANIETMFSGCGARSEHVVWRPCSSSHSEQWVQESATRYLWSTCRIVGRSA